MKTALPSSHLVHRNPVLYLTNQRSSVRELVETQARSRGWSLYDPEKDDDGDALFDEGRAGGGGGTVAWSPSSSIDGMLAEIGAKVSERRRRKIEGH